MTSVPLPPEANVFVPTSFGLPLPNPSTADELGIDLCFLPPRLTRDGDTVGIPFDTKKPTCSISLLCHRNGFLQKYQIHVISKDRCAGLDQFDSLVTSNKRLIKTDVQFFKTVKRTYEREMHPEKLHSTDKWILWVYNLRQPDRRYALEFMESWSALKISIAVSILLVSSTALGVAWAVVKDDVQTAFTVASFVLAAGSLLLAALAIVNSIESSTSDESGQRQPLQITNIDEDPANERAYPCGFPGCNKTFSMPEYSRYHRANEHGLNSTIEGPHVTEPKDTRPELE
ncbi:hypothetical protein AKAW_06576 [Aspergillus luchuensis IFO 4308]|nr:hypothetical protein AKAW_06576 [Aspergillus luchuensis IFO 4308]